MLLISRVTRLINRVLVESNVNGHSGVTAQLQVAGRFRKSLEMAMKFLDRANAVSFPMEYRAFAADVQGSLYTFIKRRTQGNGSAKPAYLSIKLSVNLSPARKEIRCQSSVCPEGLLIGLFKALQ